MSGRINYSNLSDSLKEHLNGLGLSEEQVNELIENALVEINEKNVEQDEVVNGLADKVGELNGLMTEEKGDLVGAINELFQNANNGKQLIASAIGNELITVNSTFSAMSEAILGLRRDTDNETDAREVLYNMMIEDGYNSATSSMTVDELIELLDDSNIKIDEIAQVACGADHVVIVKNDGTVWTCGNNDQGQLGLGHTNNVNVFTKVTDIDNVKQASCGWDHTFVLKNDGTVWGCGRSYEGQIGNGETSVYGQTRFINTADNVKEVICGGWNTFIIKNDNTLWGCGSNDDYELGLDTNVNYTFKQLTTDVKQVSAGYHHTVVLKNDGTVWTCGNNDYGQLGPISGLGRTYTQISISNVKQVACNNSFSTFILKNDGTVWVCGQMNSNNTAFKQITTNINNDVDQIACGYTHFFILKNDGSIWGYNSNGSGQLGLGNTTNQPSFTQVTTNINNDVKQISCGYDITFITKNDGSVWACGDNQYGQLGLGDTTDRTTFTRVMVGDSIEISEYEVNRQKLYYYLLDNEIPVTEDMDIGTMLDLLVDDYINNLILGYENNLRIILTDEGVSVSDEDNMDSLITKVDEEFDRQVIPAGDAATGDVLSGKTFINSTGETITGTMVNHPVNTNFMSVNAYNDGKLYVRIPFGAYLTPGSAGYPIIVIEDKNFISDNIIEGVTIMGVTGTAGVNGYSIVPGANIIFASNNEWESIQQSTTDNQIIYSEKQMNVVYNGSYTLSATMDFTFSSTYSSGSGEYGVTIFNSDGTINRSVCVETFTNSLSTGFTNTVKNINIVNIELLEGQYVKTYATSTTASTNGISIQTDSMIISGNLE